MPTSDRKIRANRENGQKSPGPTDTSKSRLSARKHGLAAKGLTAVDDAAAYRTIVCDLKREKNPVGILEIELVEAAAFDIVGWRRARLLEAEYITAVLNPPVHEKNVLRDLDSQFNGALLDPGIPAAIGAGNVQQLVAVFQRYESSFANRLFRTLHEFERLQRMRLGERLPAPTAVDVSIRAEAGPPGSVPVGSEPAKVLPRDGEALPRSVTADNTHANTGAKDSPPAEVEQPTVFPHDGEDFEVAVDGAEGENLLADSPPAELEPERVLPADGKDLEAAAIVDVADGETRVADSPPGELEQQRVLPADGEDFEATATVEVADGESPAADSAPVAWKPRAPSGPIWNR